jgi:hypothetical protein
MLVLTGRCIALLLTILATPYDNTVTQQQPPTAPPTPAPLTYCTGGVAVVAGTGAYDGKYIESNVITDPKVNSVSIV